MVIAHKLEIGNVDVEFEVRDGATLLGVVQISRGGIDWRPSRKAPIKATWKEFSDWMES